MSDYNHLVFFAIYRNTGNVNYYHNTIRDLPLPVTLKSWENQLHKEDRDALSLLMDRAMADGLAQIHYKMRDTEDKNFRMMQQRMYYNEEADMFTGMLVDVSHMSESTGVACRVSNEKDSLEKAIFEAAHDLQSPLKTIQGLTSLMEGEIIRLRNNSAKEKLLSYLKKIEETAGFSISVTSGILTMSKLQKMNHLALMPVHPVLFIKEYAGMLRTIFTGREIEIVTQGAVSPELSIHINDLEFKRALLNLVANAHKFSPESTPVRVGIRELMEHVEIYVEDQGMGMDNDQLQNILGPGNHVGKVGIKGEESWGLGLAMVKKIVELHGGNLVVNSREGEGTTFSIVLKKKARPRSERRIGVGQ